VAVNFIGGGNILFDRSMCENMDQTINHISFYLIDPCVKISLY